MKKKHKWYRKVRVSGAALGYARALSPREFEDFCELLIRLDADPTRHSTAVMVDGRAILREASFGAHRAILEWDYTVRPNGQVRVVACGPRR